MKKLLVLISSLGILFFATINANAASIGISAAVTGFDGDGEETVDGMNKNTGGSASQTVSGIPSIFIESDPENGWVFGIDYIPVGAEFVSESKAQTSIANLNSGTTSHTQKVEGELENHITFYIEKDVYNGVYLKGGISSVDVISNESLGTGSTYGDDRILGYMYGIGYRYDMDTMFIKLEASVTEYDSIELSATNTTNTATGDVDATSGKLSIGYKF
tara:strand:+ start:1422 stop:2075 length:654 start_codon:yes stop_codon:yes gene_type:complete